MSNTIQIRDSSDYTTFLKQRGVVNSIRQLYLNSQFPNGGIPQSDRMAVARFEAAYIPTDSVVPLVIAQSSFPNSPNEVTYSTSEIVAVSCNPEVCTKNYQDVIIIR
jgi:hypothetical protein